MYNSHIDERNNNIFVVQREIFEFKISIYRRKYVKTFSVYLLQCYYEYTGDYTLFNKIYYHRGELYYTVLYSILAENSVKTANKTRRNIQQFDHIRYPKINKTLSFQLCQLFTIDDPTLAIDR